MVSHNNLKVCPNQSRANNLALLTPCTAQHQICGGHDGGKDTTLGCIIVELQISTQAEYQISVGTRESLASALRPLGKGPGVGRRKNTHKGNTSSSSLTLNTSASATWEKTLPLTGW